MREARSPRKQQEQKSGGLDLSTLVGRIGAVLVAAGVLLFIGSADGSYSIAWPVLVACLGVASVGVDIAVCHTLFSRWQFIGVALMVLASSVAVMCVRHLA